MHWIVVARARLVASHSAGEAPHRRSLPRERDVKDGRKLDIHCGVDLEWRSADNAGSIATSAGNVPYSATGRTEGGDGPSPEVLLLAAISSCYSVTLSKLLQAASLPQTHISVHADGVIARDFGRKQFARVIV